MMNAIRAWWRKGSRVPARLLPSVCWWHTRHCIGGVSVEQALSEERAWREDAHRRWYEGENV
jgi:hypothetical protein